MDKKKSGFSGTGISLLVIVFAVLALTIFSVLSIMTARQQLSLAQKSADTQTAYYEADYRATKKLNMLSSLIINDLEAAKKAADDNNAALIEKDGCASCTFSERINDKMTLICEFTVTYKDDRTDINKWYCANTASFEDTTEISGPQINNRPE